MEITKQIEGVQNPPVLSTYTEFRDYLRDVFIYKRRTESTQSRLYSYAHFSAAADIKSPNYLKLIIEGKRNLSDQMILKFSRALKINKEDTEEFKALVHYGQAADPLQRNRHLKELSEIRAKRDLARGRIDQKTWDSIPNWVGWVLYAMLDQENVQLEPEKLQKLFRSRVSQDQLKTSLKTLIETKHIHQDENGQWKKNRSVADKAEEIPVELVRKLQSELIYLGLESLFRDSPKEREFGAFTLALTKDEFERVRFELRRFRKIIQRDVMTSRESTKGERVYQLNIQLFPVTDPESDPQLNQQ